MTPEQAKRAADVLRRYASEIEESEMNQVTRRCAPEIEAEVSEYRQLAGALEQGIARLREIEHQAWHVLDNSEERVAEGEIVVARADYEALSKLLPEDHPCTAAVTKRATVPLKVRPLLVSGMLAADDQGPVILIDSEQDHAEQVKTLWHEVLHLLGLTDEQLVGHIADKLAAADPGILRTLAPLINVPSDTTDSKPEGT